MKTPLDKPRIDDALTALVVWLNKTADVNEEMASRTTWRGNAYNRGYTEGLRVAAIALEKIMGDNPYE